MTAQCHVQENLHKNVVLRTALLFTEPGTSQSLLSLKMRTATLTRAATRTIPATALCLVYNRSTKAPLPTQPKHVRRHASTMATLSQVWNTLRVSQLSIQKHVQID